MRLSLLNKIIDAICKKNEYFVQKRDCCGVLGLFLQQKVTCALRMHVYGVYVDAMDEYCRASESTTIDSMKHFFRATRAEYEEYHLQQPIRLDFKEQMAINTNQGFLGMFISLDCMHDNWRNFLAAWQGDFRDRHNNKSIILEAIGDHSLHIWHIFFGLFGSNNDLNVLD